MRNYRHNQQDRGSLNQSPVNVRLNGFDGRADVDQFSFNQPCWGGEDEAGEMPRSSESPDKLVSSQERPRNVATTKNNECVID
jgi:hypothetical protein